MDSNYIGFKVAACAKTYYDTRRTDEAADASKVVWNYNTSGVFDVKNNFRLRGIPEMSAVSQRDKRAGEVKGNLVDCSTFAGLVLRGLDYEHSPYALNSGDAWNPSDSENGIRRLTEKYGGEWKNTELDSQTVGFTDIGYAGSSTIRYAAELAEYYTKNGEIIYDSERDGKLKKITDGNTMTGFSADNGKNIIDSILPGDLLFWSKFGWRKDDKNVSLSDYGISLLKGEPTEGNTLTVYVKGGEISCKIDADSTLEFKIAEKEFFKICPDDGEYVFAYEYKRPARYRAISHVAIAAENTKYYYEATTLKYTLYRRSLFPTDLYPDGTFGDICLIIRPKY